MSLHRIGRVSDWEKIPHTQRNYWQRIAAATHGVVTPANGVSVAGILLAAWGLACIGQHRLGPGLLLLGAGRLADIVDGYVADGTGTKSWIGEGVDATFDKLVAAGALVVFGMAHIMPWWLIALFAAQQLATVAISLSAVIKHATVHPSLTGKIVTAGQWVLVLAYAGVALWGPHPVAVDVALDVIFIGSICVGFGVASGYARTLQRKLRAHN